MNIVEIFRKFRLSGYILFASIWKFLIILIVWKRCYFQKGIFHFLYNFLFGDDDLYTIEMGVGVEPYLQTIFMNDIFSLHTKHYS